jgi:drug/metabolite transporter (DMT)-like permease
MAIVIVIAGIIIAMLGRNYEEKIRFNVPVRGFLFALGGAVGQAVGLILSKKGIENYNPIAATQIRAIAGFVSFALLITFIRQWPRVFGAFSNKMAMKDVSFGTVFGPVIGVSLLLFSIQHTKTGIASTLVGLVPIFIILPSIFILKQRVTFLQILGAVVSVGGSVLFFV